MAPFISTNKEQYRQQETPFKVLFLDLDSSIRLEQSNGRAPSEPCGDAFVSPTIGFVCTKSPVCDPYTCPAEAELKKNPTPLFDSSLTKSLKRMLSVQSHDGAKCEKFHSVRLVRLIWKPYFTFTFYEPGPVIVCNVRQLGRHTELIANCIQLVYKICGYK